MTDVPLTYQQAEAILQQMADLALGQRPELSELSELSDALAKAEAGPATTKRFKQPRRFARRRSHKRRLNERAFQRMEARYRHLVEGIPAVTFLAALDEGRNEIYVSPQIEKLLGFSQQEWLEDPVLWYTRLHPDDRDRWHAEFAQTCLLAAPFRSEYRFVARDGRVVWVQGEAQVVRDRQGRPMFLQGVAFDITDRKDAEQALRRSHEELEAIVSRRTEELSRSNHELALADRRKGEFLAMLGHELRNPLAGILNSVEVLNLGQLSTSETAGMLAIIRRQAKHMSLIIDDLLDVTRINHGKIVLRKAPLNIVEVVRQTAEDHRRGIELREGVLRVEVPSHPVYCEVDPTRLSQVVSNLLTNAAKFLGGPGEIAVRLGDDPVRGSATIQVHDTGIGIDSATLRDIFEPFVQATQRLDRSEGGLGLGLALVRGLIELHGGRVTASSPGIGQGAEFTVELPLCAPPKSEPVPPRAVTELNGRRRVLVIDDYDDALFAIRKMLELDGHEVFAATDGGQAFALVREIKPQVVLCDIGLPGMTGFEFAQAIRSEPLLNGVRLIAVSGYGSEDDRQRARESGFDHYLTKPVTRDQLKALVESSASCYK
ncbi:MAG TPA: ATP-binding protein [Pirellulales bacterium]|nr:ATP-binding protein [Pirellulales bacterium]